MHALLNLGQAIRAFQIVLSPNMRKYYGYVENEYIYLNIKHSTCIVTGADPAFLMGVGGVGGGAP